MNRSEAGIGKLTFIVFGTIFGVLFYAAFKIAPFYYYYYELLNQMNAAVRIASTEKDDFIRHKLWMEIQRMGIPVEKQDLIIERYDNRMRLRLTYQEHFFITWQGEDIDLWTFDFDAEVDKPYVGSGEQQE